MAARPRLPLQLRRIVRTAGRRVREARMLAQALQSARHPILAQIIPTRRCNLSCKSTVGILHDPSGQLRPLRGAARRVLQARGHAGR